MADFTVFSWNLQTFGKTKWDLALKSVVKAIFEHISNESPFIGFLLEVFGEKDDISILCEYLNHTLGGDYKYFTTHAFFCQGARNEWIVVLSSALPFTEGTLGVQEKIKPILEQDKADAETKFNKHLEVIKNLGLRSRSNMSFPISISPSVDKFQDYDKEPDWYRQGIICFIDPSILPISVASVHAPGPQYTDERIISAIMAATTLNKVDILIGDLNYEGDIEDGNYSDLFATTSKGTTVGKISGTLGSHRWDRILVAKGCGYRPVARDPIPPPQLEEGLFVSDHALMVVDFVKAPVVLSPPLSNGGGGGTKMDVEK